MLDAIGGLSQAQWTYKGRSRQMVGLETGTLATAPDAAKMRQRKAALTQMDDGLLAGLRDRSHKLSAPGQRWL